MVNENTGNSCYEVFPKKKKTKNVTNEQTKAENVGKNCIWKVKDFYAAGGNIVVVVVSIFLMSMKYWRQTVCVKSLKRNVVVASVCHENVSIKTLRLVFLFFRFFLYTKKKKIEIKLFVVVIFEFSCATKCLLKGKYSATTTATRECMWLNKF